MGIPVTMESVLWDTEVAARVIHGGPVVQHDPTPVQDDPPPGDEQSQEMFDSLGHPRQEGTGKIGNLGEFMTLAMQKGHGVASVVMRTLGVKRQIEIVPKYGDFDAAMKALDDAKPEVAW